MRLDELVRLSGFGERQFRPELDLEVAGGDEIGRDADGFAPPGELLLGQGVGDPPLKARMPRSAASGPRTIVAMRS